MHASVNVTNLQKALARVVRFASDDNSRPLLMGVHFEAKGNDLTVTACDGFRMGQTIIEAQIDEPFSALIPGYELEYLAKPSKQNSFLALDMVIDGQRYGNGKYPDADELFKQKANVEFKAPAELHEAVCVLRRALGTKKKGVWSGRTALFWSISPLGHVLEVRPTEDTFLKFEIPTKDAPAEEPLWVAVQIDYLQAVLLATAQDDDLQVQLVRRKEGGTQAPIMFSCANSRSRYLIMPMHVPDYIPQVPNARRKP